MAFIQGNFSSMCLKRPVKFWALVPVDSMFAPPAPGPVKPLRTMYLLHGYTGASADWLIQGLPLMDYAIAYNMAIIMPDGENHFYVDDMMKRDMYGDFIGRELVDFTRRAFPLSHRREDTVIAGISMGGYGALVNGMKYSDVFGHVIGISPANVMPELKDSTDEPNAVGSTRGFFQSVFGDLDKVYDTHMNPSFGAKLLKESGRPLPDIYFACGWNDMLCRANREFHSALTELGIDHVYQEGPGSHENPFFIPHLEAGLRHAFNLEPAPFPNPFWVDEEATSPCK